MSFDNENFVSKAPVIQSIDENEEADDEDSFDPTITELREESELTSSIPKNSQMITQKYKSSGKNSTLECDTYGNNILSSFQGSIIINSSQNKKSVVSH